MTLTRKAEMDRIQDILSYLTTKIKLSSSGSLVDINLYAENFFRDLLNLIYGYSLVNTNFTKKNAVAIDLGDFNASLAIQVTSSDSIEKVRTTVEQFIRKKLYKKYSKLKILILTAKKQRKPTIIGESGLYEFNLKKDIWDVSDLLNKIDDKSLDEISGIRVFLEKEVRLPSSESIHSELETFQRLITLVSDEAHPGAGKGYIEEPDPTGKIEHRFSNHQVYLKNLYKDLYIEYGDVLKEVQAEVNLSTLKVRRLRLYLQLLSDDTLNECGGHAQKALNQLVEHFSVKMSNSGFSHDLEAIRFYLIHELIQCNIFPNKEVINVKLV